MFKNNYIHEAYGEGVDFLKYGGSSTISNKYYKNGFSMNIYYDASKNILIDGNNLWVNFDNYTKWGNSYDVGLDSDSEKSDDIENIVIQNNVTIGQEWEFIGTDGYGNFKILHNTL